MSDIIKRSINRLKKISEEIEETSAYSGWLEIADELFDIAEKLEQYNDKPKTLYKVMSGRYEDKVCNYIFLKEEYANAAKDLLSKYDRYDEHYIKKQEIEDDDWESKSHKDFYDVNICYVCDIENDIDDIAIEITEGNDYIDHNIRYKTIILPNDNRFYHHYKAYGLLSESKAEDILEIRMTIKVYDENEANDKDIYLKMCRDILAQIKYLIYMDYPLPDINELIFQD